MQHPIIDLHCDLLAFLEEKEGRSPYDDKVHCSFPQLKAGNVKLQIMAIFVETTSQSVKKGMRQLEIYQKLPELYGKDVQFFDRQSDYLNLPTTSIAYAFENASAFCSEQESLEEGLRRFGSLESPTYVSLTWNGENRFGGGDQTNIGLKEDGKVLLEILNEKNIAIDFSHTSDRLAFDILDYMEKKGLTIPVLASHSNARKVLSLPRNLPDSILKELFRRKGFVGLNLYRRFLGESPEAVMDHLLHFFELGGEEAIGFGADFFYEEDFPHIAWQYGITEPYFRDYSDADCYPRLLADVQRFLGVNEDLIRRLAYENGRQFLSTLIR